VKRDARPVPGPARHPRHPGVRLFAASGCVWRIVTGEPILQVIALRSCESGLSLTFGTHPVAVKRSDPRSTLRWRNTERFLGGFAEVDRSERESLTNQAASGV